MIMLPGSLRDQHGLDVPPHHGLRLEKALFRAVDTTPKMIRFPTGKLGHGQGHLQVFRSSSRLRRTSAPAVSSLVWATVFLVRMISLRLPGFQARAAGARSEQLHLLLLLLEPRLVRVECCILVDTIIVSTGHTGVFRASRFEGSLGLGRLHTETRPQASCEGFPRGDDDSRNAWHYEPVSYTPRSFIGARSFQVLRESDLRDALVNTRLCCRSLPRWLRYGSLMVTPHQQAYRKASQRVRQYGAVIRYESADRKGGMKRGIFSSTV